MRNRVRDKKGDKVGNNTAGRLKDKVKGKAGDKAEKYKKSREIHAKQTERQKRTKAQREGKGVK